MSDMNVFEEVFRTATRQWSCSFCGNKIKKGEKYLKSRGHIDAKIGSSKKCQRCTNASLLR